MTGIVDRLNTALLKRIGGDRAEITVEGGAVVAYRQPGYADDRLTLALAYDSGARIEISEGTAAWTAIRAELDRHARVMPSTEWYPRLIVSGADAVPLVVFQKSSLG